MIYISRKPVTVCIVKAGPICFVNICFGALFGLTTCSWEIGSAKQKLLSFSLFLSGTKMLAWGCGLLTVLKVRFHAIWKFDSVMNLFPKCQALHVLFLVRTLRVLSVYASISFSHQCWIQRKTSVKLLMKILERKAYSSSESLIKLNANKVHNFQWKRFTVVAHKIKQGKFHGSTYVSFSFIPFLM